MGLAFTPRHGKGTTRTWLGVEPEFFVYFHTVSTVGSMSPTGITPEVTPLREYLRELPQRFTHQRALTTVRGIWSNRVGQNRSTTLDFQLQLLTTLSLSLFFVRITKLRNAVCCVDSS